jgi:hypothetical protein
MKNHQPKGQVTKLENLDATATYKLNPSSAKNRKARIQMENLGLLPNSA